MVELLFILISCCFNGGNCFADDEHFVMRERGSLGSVAIAATGHDVISVVAERTIETIKAESRFGEFATAVVARQNAKPIKLFAADAEWQSTPIGNGFCARELAVQSSRLFLSANSQAWPTTPFIAAEFGVRFDLFAGVATPGRSIVKRLDLRDSSAVSGSIPRDVGSVFHAGILLKTQHNGEA